MGTKPKGKIYICVECKEDCIWYVLDAGFCKLLPNETSDMNQSVIKTPLQNGSAVLGHCIYVIGGLCTTKYNVRIYNSKKRKWKFGKSMDVTRHSPLVVPVPSYNMLFVFGGTEEKNRENWACSYDIDKDKWEVLQSPDNIENLNLNLTGHVVLGDTLVLWNQDLFYTFNVKTKEWHYRVELKLHLPTIHSNGKIFVGGIVPRAVRLEDSLFWFNGAELLNYNLDGEDNTLDSLVSPWKVKTLFEKHFQSLTPHFMVEEKKLEDNTLDSLVSPQEAKNPAETLYRSYFQSLTSCFLVLCSEQKRLCLIWCDKESEPRKRVCLFIFQLRQISNHGPFYVKVGKQVNFETVGAQICHCLTMQKPSEANSNDKSGLRDEIRCEENLLKDLSRVMYIKNYLSLSRYKGCEVDSAAKPVSGWRKVEISMGSLMQGLGLEEKYGCVLHRIIDVNLLYQLNDDDIKALNIPVSHKPARCAEQRAEGDSDTEEIASGQMIYEIVPISSSLARVMAPNLRKVREEPVLRTPSLDIKHLHDKAGCRLK